jgi:peptide/nickel transport system substrate-binding protein
MSRWAYFFWIGIWGCLIAGCASPNNAGKKVFRMNLDEGLTTLDPAYARDQRTIWMTAQLFNGLVALDSMMNVVPALAQSWEVSSDALVYTFHLRNDVYFQKHPAFGRDSTRKCTAFDVKYSFTRICDPKVASTGVWVFFDKIQGLQTYRDKKSPDVSGFVALDDTTFQIRLDKPFPDFLSLLAMPYGLVVPHEVVDLDPTGFGHRPIGTGAFQFYQWKEGSHLILHKNPLYFERENGQPLPYLDGIYVQFISSKISEFISFKQGQLDFINNLDNSYKDEILTPQGDIQTAYRDKYTFYVSPQLITYYIGIMVDSLQYEDKNHPLLNKKFRQLLASSIDKQKFVTYMINNLGYPAKQGFIPKGCKGFDENADIRISSALPEKLPSPLPPLTLHCSPSQTYLAEFVQKEWAKNGISVKVEVLQPGALRKEVYQGKLKLWLANWIGDYPDAETYLALGYTPNHAPKGPNTTHFSDKEYDKLYDEAKYISDDSLRYLHYQKMNRIFTEACPVIPIFYKKIFRMTQKNVSGIAVNALNFLDLTRCKVR